MRSLLPFPCVPDRPHKILLVQVGTLSFSHPLFGVASLLFIYSPTCENTKNENETFGGGFSPTAVLKLRRLARKVARGSVDRTRPTLTIGLAKSSSFRRKSR